MGLPDTPPQVFKFRAFSPKIETKICRPPIRGGSAGQVAQPDGRVDRSTRPIRLIMLVLFL